MGCKSSDDIFLQGGTAMFLKRSIFTVLLPLLLVGMLLAACGTPSSTGNGGGTTPTPTPTTAPAPPVVMTASATVNGKQVTILTDTHGMTLYYFTPDTATTAACGPGQCVTNWPPLAFSGSGTPTSATSLPGTLSVVTSVNGAQVQYQGHFLYTFAGDKASGDTKGEGLAGGKWLVATTDLAMQSNGNNNGY